MIKIVEAIDIVLIHNLSWFDKTYIGNESLPWNISFYLTHLDC